MAEVCEIQLDHFPEMATMPLASKEAMVIEAVLYLLGEYAFTRFMRDRKPLNVGTIAKIHNTLLALFSFVCLVIGSKMAYDDGRFSSHDCFHCHAPRSRPYSFLVYAVYLSKFWELVDTALLVASKKPVIWLHRIHHLTMVSGVGLNFHGGVAYDVHMLLINLFIHAVMYIYYAFPRALKSLRMFITIGQLTQFAVVLTYSSMHMYGWAKTGQMPCNESPYVLSYIHALTIIYMTMFANFFYVQYISKKAAKSKSVKISSSPEKAKAA
eukprot:Colp12_sorted_trinity150504_noHs@26961